MTTPPGLRERKKQETRHHIATTALGMFLERGFDEVPVSDVAEAAGVSKMTVFNHFPAKEDLVFALSGRPLPDLAGAVRDRAPGQSAVDAVRGVVRRDLMERGSGEARHEEGMTKFLRMAFRSPTLISAFGRQWQEVQSELAVELAVALGEPAPPADIEVQFFDAVRGDADGKAIGDWLKGMNERSMIPFFVSGQIVSTLQQITMTNLVRVAAGVSLKASTKDALRDVDTAFGLLELGIADIGATRPKARSPMGD